MASKDTHPEDPIAESSQSISQIPISQLPPHSSISLEQLKKEYVACTRCSALCRSRIQVVFGSGNPRASILFIGEAPGATEDRLGVPFCGASGQVLGDLLHTIGLLRDDVFITNTILCRPENNRNPEKSELENCRSRLDMTILLIRPAVIVTIGNFATERILHQSGITKLRGTVHKVDIDGHCCQVVPIIHPANYLYNGRSSVLWEQMVKDFKIIDSLLLRLSLSERPRPARVTGVQSTIYQF